MKGLAENCQMIIKRADKRPCVVLLDRGDYLVELGKQLQDADIYEDTDFKESDMFKLVE